MPVCVHPTRAALASRTALPALAQQVLEHGAFAVQQMGHDGAALDVQRPRVTPERGP